MLSMLYPGETVSVSHDRDAGVFIVEVVLFRGAKKYGMRETVPTPIEHPFTDPITALVHRMLAGLRMNAFAEETPPS